jgi:hypothetical protein
MAMRRRWGAAVAAVVLLVVIVTAVVIGAVGGGHPTPRGTTSPPSGPVSTTAPATTPPTAAASPSAADVAAARACQAFAVYLEDATRGNVPAAAGRRLIEDAAALLQGSSKDQTAHRALPKWAPLGSDLLASADDVVTHKSAALRTDGAAAGAQCRKVPASAARAGGFQRAG